MCMPVSVTELETFMTSQTPQLFDNVPLVAMSCWRVTRSPTPLPLLPTCHFDHTVEIAYGELGRSLARNVQGETDESGGKSARSETGQSQLRTPFVAPSHMPVLDLSRVFTYSFTCVLFLSQYPTP